MQETQRTQVQFLGQEYPDPGGGNGNPLQYSCLGNLMDRGAWWQATVPEVMQFSLVQLLSRVRLFINPMDYSPPGSPVHGISQARILEWLAISSSRGYSRPRDQTRISCVSYAGRQILYH